MKIRKRTSFHYFSWTSHEPWQTANTVAPAVTLATGKEIDKGKLLLIVSKERI